MTKYVEWVEPWGTDQKQTVIMRMSYEDIAEWQRQREPRYTSDEQAIEDFEVVHWGHTIETDEYDK